VQWFWQFWMTFHGPIDPIFDSLVVPKGNTTIKYGSDQPKGKIFKNYYRLLFNERTNFLPLNKNHWSFKNHDVWLFYWIPFQLEILIPLYPFFDFFVEKSKRRYSVVGCFLPTPNLPRVKNTRHRCIMGPMFPVGKVL